MPLNHEWQSRIKAVEREYVVMRQAADRFQRAALNDPTILLADLRHGEVLIASQKLEGTYVIRLFAEFESGLRQYWATRWTTHPRTADLLTGLAAQRHIPDLQLENAHLVREYRNALVHERDDDPDPIPLATSRGFLCHFFSFLPPQW
jgi:hypothetical protein